MITTIFFVFIGLVVLFAIIRMIAWAITPSVVIVDRADDEYLDVATGVVAGSIVGAVVAEEIIAHSAPQVVYESITAIDYTDAEVISGETEVTTEE